MIKTGLCKLTSLVLGTALVLGLATTPQQNAYAFENRAEQTVSAPSLSLSEEVVNITIPYNAMSATHRVRITHSGFTGIRIGYDHENDKDVVTIAKIEGNELFLLASKPGTVMFLVAGMQGAVPSVLKTVTVHVARGEAPGTDIAQPNLGVDDSGTRPQPESKPPVPGPKPPAPEPKPPAPGPQKPEPGPGPQGPVPSPGPEIPNPDEGADPSEPGITVDDGKGSSEIAGGKVTVQVEPSEKEGFSKVTATILPNEGQKADSLVVLSDGKPRAYLPGAGNTVVFDVADASAVKIIPVFKTALAHEGSFGDVAGNAWYGKTVYDAYNLGYMGGYGSAPGQAPVAFGPADRLTRGQAAIIFFNMAGGNYQIHGRYNAGILGWSDHFTDVPDALENTYRNAVVWANEKGLVEGYAETGTFGPDDTLTREQVCTILARYASLEGTGLDYTPLDGEEAEAVLVQFPDAPTVSHWARSTVAWAAKNGIIGRGGYLAGTDAISRAEMAAMATRIQPEGLELGLYPTA